MNDCSLPFLLAALGIFCSHFSTSLALTALRRENDTRPLCKCGHVGRTLETRVVGGHDALRGQFPYATALLSGRSYYRQQNEHQNEQLNNDIDIFPYCGATLITDRHVLTAAHCVRGRTAKDIALDVSDFDIEASPKPQERQLRKAEQLMQHPKHQKEGFINDVAVIEFSGPVRLSSRVRAAWLPAPGVQLSPGTTVTVFGWGRLSYHGNSPHVLQTLDIPVVDSERCQEHYVTKIRDSMMMCAGGEEGRDACIGDSGSGLMTRLNNEYVMVGAVSFGKGCALPETPGVYTKISSYVDWIYEQTRSADCQPCIASPGDFNK